VDRWVGIWTVDWGFRAEDVGNEITFWDGWFSPPPPLQQLFFSAGRLMNQSVQNDRFNLILYLSISKLDNLDELEAC